MKLLRIILCVCLNVTVALAQAPSDSRNESAKTDARSGQAQLQLTTTVTKEHYAVELGTTFLRWTLKLTYTNTGAQPVLLDKKSSVIYK